MPSLIGVFLAVVGLTACGGGGGTATRPAGPGNEVVITPPGSGPDLAVGALSVSDSGPDPGGQFTLSATVTNEGDASSAATTVRYYRSTDGTVTRADTAVGTDAVGSLSASGTSAESSGLRAPSTPGTYYYGGCVDDVADQSDTSDNCSATAKVTVQ